MAKGTSRDVAPWIIRVVRAHLALQAAENAVALAEKARDKAKAEMAAALQLLRGAIFQSVYDPCDMTYEPENHMVKVDGRMWLLKIGARDYDVVPLQPPKED